MYVNYISIKNRKYIKKINKYTPLATPPKKKKKKMKKRKTKKTEKKNSYLGALITRVGSDTHHLQKCQNEMNTQALTTTLSSLDAC